MRNGFEFVPGRRGDTPYLRILILRFQSRAISGFQLITMPASGLHVLAGIVADLVGEVEALRAEVKKLRQQTRDGRNCSAQR